MSQLHIGLDLGKNWFHIVGLDQQGRSVLQKKTSRAHLVNTFAQLPKAVVGMEACSGAHYFAARLREFGHDVRLIPGQFVKPYRKAQKNDFNDAEAIAEAVSRANMRFLRARSMEELQLQAFHRARDRIVVSTPHKAIRYAPSCSRPASVFAKVVHPWHGESTSCLPRTTLRSRRACADSSRFSGSAIRSSNVPNAASLASSKTLLKRVRPAAGYSPSPASAS